MSFLFPPVKFHLEVMEECRTTQEILLWKRGEPGFHGSAVLAKKQTAGYGRRGREWSTGIGNLALSFGLEIPGSLNLGLLPFVSGLALARVSSRYLPPEANLRLKWPNDLYLNGKKLSGLISQARQYAEGSEVVVGIGLNLAQVPPDLAQQAASLSQYGRAPKPEVFAEALLCELENIFVEAADFSWLRGHWERAAQLQNDPLFIVGEKDPVIPLALLPTGELLVRGADGEERKLSSEEISLRFEPIAGSATAPSP